MEHFSITLEAARVNARLSQEQLSKMLGVCRTTVHNWETGKTSPDAVFLRKIGEITGVPLDYIFLPDTLLKVENPTDKETA